ncbi:hypothetical protein LCGC14_2216120 [marine sediment metagenome]|uniref:Uncharacterized protein n=1 Tax=marine sediment metagenome TaxID=412755 RepID=A0A0F9DCJ0_9ZZZZ
MVLQSRNGCGHRPVLLLLGPLIFFDLVHCAATTNRQTVAAVLFLTTESASAGLRKDE